MCDPQRVVPPVGHYANPDVADLKALFDGAPPRHPSHKVAINACSVV